MRKRVSNRLSRKRNTYGVGEPYTSPPLIGHFHVAKIGHYHLGAAGRLKTDQIGSEAAEVPDKPEIDRTFPSGHGIDHEKYSTGGSAARRYSWKAA